MRRYNHRVPFDRELIEAKLALELIASADMPSIAWNAWEAGMDGPATRRLGALEHPTYFEVCDLLPLVMKELGLLYLPLGEAACRIAKRIAQEILQTGDDPLQHTRDFELLWLNSGYAHEIISLGTLHDDVWVAQSTGQSEEEIRKWVTSTLKDFAEPRNTK
jgi:hypothetical protein